VVTGLLEVGAALDERLRAKLPAAAGDSSEKPAKHEKKENNA
jgi:hypothetical protein